MIDYKLFRAEPQRLNQNLRQRGYEETAEAFFKLDAHVLSLGKALEDLQRRRNAYAKEIGAASPEKRQALVAEGTRLKEEIEKQEALFKEKKVALDDMLAGLPNIAADDVPRALTEAGNVLLKTVGDKPSFSFKPKAHDVLGGELGLSSPDGVKLSGARFAVLKGQLARVERALAQMMLDMHTKMFGYQEVSVPFLVNEDCLFGVGQLPKFHHEAFQTTEGRWLISTGEVPLVNLLRNETFTPQDLPKLFVAHTPCFRSEAGAAGRDTKGLIRLHQFSKVELVGVSAPDASWDLHDKILSHAEAVLEKLGLHYRVMVLASGDMGFQSAKTYDIEVWMPGQDAYREISSCSNCTDFQARRIGARFKGDKGEKGFVHTLNASGLPLGRTMAALIETYQQADGTVQWPPALQAYLT